MLKQFLRAFCQRLFRVRVHGDQAHLSGGNLLIVANHTSLLDGLLLSLFVPPGTVFIIQPGSVARVLYRWCLPWITCIGMDSREAIGARAIIRQLEQGGRAVAFPEGRISQTGGLMKIYDGAAAIALRTGADIVAVHIEGLAHSLFGTSRAGGRRVLLPRVSLFIHPPQRLSVTLAAPARDRRRQAAEALRRVMQQAQLASRPPLHLFQAYLAAMRRYGRWKRILEDVHSGPASYAALLRRALALGRLCSRISAEREVLGLLLPNSTTTLCTMLGLWAVRRVPAMLNYTAGSAGVRSALETVAIRCVLTSRQFVVQAGLEALVAALPAHVVYLEDLRERLGWRDRLWLAGPARWWPGRVARGGQVDDTAVVMFTSGSEGQSKGVALSHRSLAVNMQQVRSVIDFGPSDRFFNALPLFHVFSLNAGTLLPMLAGSPVYLYPSPLHYRTIAELIYARNCTVLLGTGTFLQQYGRHAHPYDFYRLRYVVAGGEKLAEPVADLYLRKFGIRILEGYGATESSAVLALNTPQAARPGTVGQLLPGIDYRLEPLPGCQAGQLLHVRGENLMQGYYLPGQPGSIRMPDSPYGPGWYCTGDMVSVDADGFITVAGRLRRFAKVAGEMVSLEVVEKIAAQASPARRHAAVTAADPRRGETIVLYTTDHALERRHLRQAGADLGYPEIALPRRVEGVRDLPLLASGKIDYRRLQDLANNNKAHAVHAAPATVW